MRVRANVFAPVFGLLIMLAGSASAQGKSHGHGAKGSPPGQARKVVTVRDGVSSTRYVLEQQGYHVWRVEPMGTSQVVYFYRGNNGRGRGHGPVERIIIRPARERVILDGASKPLILAIQARLGL